jgi:hypothetical protein
MTPAQINKKYRDNNPERWLASLSKYHKGRWICECGIEVCNQVRPRHRRSARHIERMELIERSKKEALEEAGISLSPKNEVFDLESNILSY